MRLRRPLGANRAHVGHPRIENQIASGLPAALTVAEDTNQDCKQKDEDHGDEHYRVPRHETLYRCRRMSSL